MNNKDTIYIDIDDEITGIIDKVNGSAERIVALVLPKRASVLQSVVNMKLLKRSADDAKKQVVLITSEAGLLPLAGSVGMYVANTLQSKPAIPSAHLMTDATEDIDEPVTLDDDFDVAAAAAVPIGVLSQTTAADEAPARLTEEPESIDIDDATAPVAVVAPITAAKKAGKGSDKGNKKLAVPNFTRFRKRLILAALLLILLIGGGYVGATVLPKATITVYTDTSTIVTDKTITLSTTQKAVDVANSVLPATMQQSSSTATQQAATTGQKNAGTKATGQVTITNCDTNPIVLPAGTGVSVNGVTFITQSSTGTLYSSTNHSQCVAVAGFTSKTINITAAQGGSQYNITGPINNFTVAPASDGSYNASAVQAQSANGTSGGTDNMIKVVAQADIDGAKAKLTAGDSAAAQSDLQTKLQTAGDIALPVTFTASQPSITTSANVGDQADTVTVTQTINYSMFGLTKADLVALVTNNVNGQIDTSKQAILDDGVAQATFKLVGNIGGPTVQVEIHVSSTAGPKLDVATIKQQTAGKKSGDIQTLLKAQPGVQSVTVKLSPFWVTTVPKDATKVTVNFAKATGGSNGQ